jgi:hypothetical protein
MRLVFPHYFFLIWPFFSFFFSSSFRNIFSHTGYNFTRYFRKNNKREKKVGKHIYERSAKISFRENRILTMTPKHLAHFLRRVFFMSLNLVTLQFSNLLKEVLHFAKIFGFW